jgi:hypothetical protein
MIGELGENVGEPSFWIGAVQLASFAWAYRHGKFKCLDLMNVTGGLAAAPCAAKAAPPAIITAGPRGVPACPKRAGIGVKDSRNRTGRVSEDVRAMHLVAWD